MLVYPPIGLEINIHKDKVQTIVIENPKLFYEIANDIIIDNKFIIKQKFSSL